jgi:hypothetical protein
MIARCDFTLLLYSLCKCKTKSEDTSTIDTQPASLADAQVGCSGERDQENEFTSIGAVRHAETGGSTVQWISFLETVRINRHYGVSHIGESSVC